MHKICKIKRRLYNTEIEIIFGMTRFNIRIESNTSRAKTRIVSTMIRSKIRIVKRSAIKIGEDVISSGMGEGRRV